MVSGVLITVKPVYKDRPWVQPSALYITQKMLGIADQEMLGRTETCSVEKKNCNDVHRSEVLYLWVTV